MANLAVEQRGKIKQNIEWTLIFLFSRALLNCIYNSTKCIHSAYVMYAANRMHEYTMNRLSDKRKEMSWPSYYDCMDTCWKMNNDDSGHESCTAKHRFDTFPTTTVQLNNMGTLHICCTRTRTRCVCWCERWYDEHLIG